MSIESRLPGYAYEDQCENPKEAYLLQQFDNPEKIELNGEIIDVVDIAPTELKSETPTVIVPGFSATPETLKDLIIRTAEVGRRVISAEAPHGIDTDGKQAELPEAEMRKMEVLWQILENKKLDKINVIANSEAAIYVTTLAALHPERFSNIVLVEPAGLIGEDKFFKLLKRFVQDAREEEKQAKFKKKVKYPSSLSTGVKSILSNMPASIREVSAISNSDITKTLQRVRKSGVGISIIHAVDDKVFPM